MEFRRLSPGFSVCAQIAPGDVPAIREAGFRSILCNRPDGEAPDQPVFATVEEAARAAGLAAHYMPVQSGGVTRSDAETLAAALCDLPQPVLAYCRSGSRSASLWSLQQEGIRPATGTGGQAQEPGAASA